VTRAKAIPALLLFTVFCTESAPAHSSGTRKQVVDRKAVAEQSLMQGRIDESIATLQSILAANPNDGRADLLLCRAYYAEEQPDQAVAACEDALHTLSASTEAQDWMGRAYGMKADRSGPLAGFKLAHKVSAAFEQAVKLGPNNGAAVNDLSEFYINAPSVVGGGVDKALDLADRSASQLPQQAHRIRALVAEKHHDFTLAEHEFRAAIDVANKPEAWVDLGHYYSRRKQDDQAVDALKQALANDHAKDDALVDVASILHNMHREPQLTLLVLNQYLAGSAKSDAAPVVKVYVLLGKVLAEAGDKAGAKMEFQKALQLASNYTPAKHALEEL
jgi:tetratricopeptide (TPR) repeat protein